MRLRSGRIKDVVRLGRLCDGAVSSCRMSWKLVAMDKLLNEISMVDDAGNDDADEQCGWDERLNARIS